MVVESFGPRADEFVIRLPAATTETVRVPAKDLIRLSATVVESARLLSCVAGGEFR